LQVILPHIISESDMILTPPSHISHLSCFYWWS